MAGIDTRTIDEIRGWIEQEVASGFHHPDAIMGSAVEIFGDDAEPDVLSSIVERLTGEAVAAHRDAQATWPDVTDCDRLDEAMSELTRAGIVCRQDFSCCGNCGQAEIGMELNAERQAGLNVRGYAFYHMQDTEAATAGHGVFLQYGAVQEGEPAGLQIGAEIVDLMRRHGLESDWNERLDTRIKIKLDWKRRLPEE